MIVKSVVLVSITKRATKNVNLIVLLHIVIFVKLEIHQHAKNVKLQFINFTLIKKLVPKTVTFNIVLPVKMELLINVIGVNWDMFLLTPHIHANLNAMIQIVIFV
jgi:hypothetical protein